MIPRIAEINVTADTLSCIIDSVDPAEGQPGSQENIPAKVIPIPKIMIKRAPILDVKLSEKIFKSESPKRLKKIPEGINPT